MSIALKKRPAAGVPTPSVMHVTFFVDENGNPALKDSEGVVTPATNAGGPLQLDEQENTPVTVAGAVKVYSKNVDGNSELFSLNGNGEEVQITAGNGLTSNTTIRWKDDEPGQLFDATNVVPTHTDVVAVLIDPATTLSGTGVKEGFTINNGDRVLRACALTQTENQVTNGIYIAAAGAWARAADANTGAEIQDAIVEIVTDPGPPAVAERWAFWNPSGVPITVGSAAQNWVIVIDDNLNNGSESPMVVSVDDITLSGTQTIDDVALNDGDTILVAGQNNPIDNGLYIVRAGAWERNFPYTDGFAIGGVFTVKIQQGTVYTDRVFLLNTNSFYRSSIIGVDPLVFTLFNAADLGSFGPVRADANYNDTFLARSVSANIPSWGYFVVTLPPITPGSAGKRVTFVNYGGKKKKKANLTGAFIAQPAGTDVVGDGGPGEAQFIFVSSADTYLMSDGFGRWAVLGGISLSSALLEGVIVPEPPAPPPVP